MNAFMPIALLILCLGCTAIYLASPNQRWLARPLPGRISRIARLGGFLLLALGWLALRQTLQAVTASFFFLTFLMLVFSLQPYIGALLHKRGGR